MEIVKMKKEEDLEMVKSLVDNKENFESDDIIWDRSKKCIAKNGDLLGFVLIKPNSLIDFFGGEIPAETNVTDDRKYTRRNVINYLKDYQYEVLFYVNKIGDSYIESDDVTDFMLQYELSTSIEVNDDDCSIDQVLWSKNKLPDFVAGYKPFNDIIYINIPILD